MSREPRAVRAYRALVRLLPGAVRDRDGEEMVATFAALLASAGSSWARAGCLVRSFGWLPWVAAAEWRDHLRGGGWPTGSIGRGARVGLRSLLRAPAFTWSAVLLLGLGVGAVTTVFTLMDHLFLRPLPYPNAERLVRVENGSHSFPSLGDFEAISSVEAWAASSTSEVDLTGEGDPVQLVQARVTEGFFAFFGARPSAGRLLAPEDYVAGDAVVLTDVAWERVWGRDPEVLGRQVRIDGAPAVVVGVLEPSFSPPEIMLDGGSADLWRPVDRSHRYFDDRGWHTLAVAGRLRPGATLEDANREAAVVAERRARAFPDAYVRRDGSIASLPIVSLQEATVGRAREGLSLLFGAVTLLLLVACANVAHLFMARAVARGREMALRRALGAGTAALAGQLLIESLLVATAGALVGVPLAAAGLEAFLTLSPEAVPRSAGIALDGRVLAFAAALSAVTAVAFGLLPAIRISGRERADTLRAGGRTATFGRATRALQSGLLVTEVALSLVLVTGAGLLIRSFARLHDQPLGFRTEDVWTMAVRLAAEEDPEAWTRRMDAVVESLGRVPGVRSVTYGASVPLVYSGGDRCCWGNRVGRPDVGGDVRAMIHPFGGDWPGVFEPAVLAGRPWSRTDLEAAPPPALLNEPLALELFGSARGAIGREVAFVQGAVYHVLGVVAEDRHYGPDQEHGAAMYVPVETVPFALGGAAVAVRLDGAARDVPRALRQAVWSVEPDVPLPLVRSMEEWAGRATARTRFESWLFSAFGIAALVLAAGGLYGTLLYAVGMERRELGIRIALGAGRRSVEGRILGRGLASAVAGAGIGLVGASATGRLLESRLFGVESSDPATLLIGVSVLLATAGVACWLPARRAAMADPLEVLRQE
jgi:predicted permease